MLYGGLDLGQMSDPSAFAGIEQRRTTDDRGRPANAYAVRRLDRFPLGTPYPKQVALVKAVYAAPPWSGRPLAADMTGVGRPVVDMLRAAQVRCILRPVTITGGNAINDDMRTGEVHVPKKELVGALQVPLSSRRFWIDPALPDAQLLGKELENFKIKITIAANEVFGAWREGEHDDLVLAVAMAVWLAERSSPAGAAGWAPLPAPRNPRPTVAGGPTGQFRKGPSFIGRR